MGVLILVEAQYYKGDWIQTAGVEGEVQEVGLRRTVLRDGDGSVHSVSNGLIRNVSNMTRIFAVMRVDVLGVSGGEVEAAIAVIDRVGVEMAAEPAWTAMLLETPAYFQVSELTNLGATLRVRARVRPDARWTVAGELRRRLAVASGRGGHRQRPLAASVGQRCLHGRGQRGGRWRHGRRRFPRPADHPRSTSRQLARHSRLRCRRTRSTVMIRLTRWPFCDEKSPESR